MSKWINKELFEDFRKEKIEEKDNPTGGGLFRSALLWETPQKGTTEQAKIYEGRFLPDPTGEFYKKYYYHFWQSGDNWIFILCPKTHDFKNYCPFCSAVNQLYRGNKEDKKQGGLLKRKERFVGNFFVIKDSRDEERDEEKKVIGKVKLYEFPAQVEKKLKNEITDKDQGYGYQIFDPSSEGRNIILKVLATKKDKDGKQYPDYSSSSFSRSQSALGTDEKIDEIMATCTNITDYINSMEIGKEKQAEILKNEFLWDFIEDECSKNNYFDGVEISNNSQEEQVPEQQEEVPQQEEDPQEEQVPEQQEEETQEQSNSENVDVEDLSDDDLLKELDSL